MSSLGSQSSSLRRDGVGGAETRGLLSSTPDSRVLSSGSGDRSHSKHQQHYGTRATERQSSQKKFLRPNHKLASGLTDSPVSFGVSTPEPPRLAAPLLGRYRYLKGSELREENPTYDLAIVLQRKYDASLDTDVHAKKILRLTCRLKSRFWEIFRRSSSDVDGADRKPDAFAFVE